MLWLYYYYYSGNLGRCNLELTYATRFNTEEGKLQIFRQFTRDTKGDLEILICKASPCEFKTSETIMLDVRGL